MSSWNVLALNISLDLKAYLDLDDSLDLDSSLDLDAYSFDLDASLNSCCVLQIVDLNVSLDLDTAPDLDVYLVLISSHLWWILKHLFPVIFPLLTFHLGARSHFYLSWSFHKWIPYYSLLWANLILINHLSFLLMFCLHSLVFFSDTGLLYCLVTFSWNTCSWPGSCSSGSMELLKFSYSSFLSPSFIIKLSEMFLNSA